jgi:hypothetical protein
VARRARSNEQVVRVGSAYRPGLEELHSAAEGLVAVAVAVLAHEGGLSVLDEGWFREQRARRNRSTLTTEDTG